ncbi:phage antirepressor protein [Candidatus Peregrinibacteria bacterium CG_4_10_14_0_2_um_filter_43_11]|nr:MAG: phage antirepressor protein [Candidatus Peregrinibacteria bacterium CG_4_10_14_0_2_um_filter_43_11]
MQKNDDNQETKIAIFKGKEVRRTTHKKEWWFVINDVVEVLTDTSNSKDYIRKMRLRDEELSKGWGQIVTPLSVETAGGTQKLNCSNTEGIFRIVQSITSPKAEPFKRWLAQVGYERIQEIEDPELGTKRTRALYKAKGYPEGWIEKRMRGIEVRETLTDEWQKRGVKEGKEYSILTAEIAKATFGMTPNQHKKYKALKRENLRDHMTDLELIFSMLGEAATTEITKNKNVQGFPQNKKAAQQGGEVAGKARKDVEQKSGKRVVSKENFLGLANEKKKQISNEKKKK